ncbi:hypothetical protein BO83DRAFT_375522 [Aspergillus eucalypticola CBS 122712]|uniref:Cyclase n=1 Tax=Aspergillus eucalypticola (strain CBS 122712 / IBT 29274) TaxID=1448314 RepID=A0A317W5I1_ASPEC|nr:uncharacterized protein BO83DRAFT_375522 [Aspergillus eucalypticola CBS 122712]PWY81329.1 hypothetical protein BO83DRAFT_375522 [Aspergillus eucalypticola CBS 122712]
MAESLPQTYDDLPDKRRYWPAAPNSADEGLGMLRLLTPAVVANAARTQIQTGERVCLNWDLEKLNPPGFGRKPFAHQVKWRRVFYGGTTSTEILDPSSARIGIAHWAKKGIAGRGVLIDYASYIQRTKGITVNALTRHTVSLDDVLTIAKECNITFQPGDILFLRVGLPTTWDNMSDEEKVEYSQQQTPQHAGLEQSERVVRFLWDQHFAAVAGDAVSFEVYPPVEKEWDLHHFLLAGWGVPIGEMFDLEGLKEVCERLGRWTFFVSSSPLNCKTGVSSPPNCMAIF